jgi:hypothetical protein
MNKGIFQIHPKVPVSIAHARESYNICRYVHHPSYKPTKDDYAIHGVDGEMVEKYIDVVERLEKQWTRTDLKPS